MIVILLVADSLRADAPGYAGSPAKTPFLDNLAKEGTRFEDMFASAAWTIPSLMSMFTGTLGHKIGVCRWRQPFPAHRPTLLTAFADSGFEVTCFHPYAHWGFLTVTGKGKVGNSQDPEAIIKALKGHKGQDRFVTILHWWTHLPYMNRELSMKNWHAACDLSLDSLKSHPDHFAKKLQDAYWKSVSYFSEELLPRYLEAASASGEEVLLFFTGDHGETWGKSWPEGHELESVYDLHGRWITDETIRIPFLAHGKGTEGSIPSGQILNGFASGVDVGPTIADLAGIPWPGPVPEKIEVGQIDRGKSDLDIIGKSLATCIKDGKPAPRKEVLTLSSHNTNQPRTYPEKGTDMWRRFALRTKDSWHIWDGVDQERQIHPIGDKSSDENDADEIFERLEALRQQAVDSGPLLTKEHVWMLRGDDEIIKQKLMDLGYLD